MAKGAEEEEPSWAGDSGQGHADYLRARKLWDWGGEDPMFSANQGGRVGAQAGMYAGQGLGSLQGAEAGMSQINQPADQGILEQASVTTDQGTIGRLRINYVNPTAGCNGNSIGTVARKNQGRISRDDGLSFI